MEELTVPLPQGGELKALRLQDLPRDYVFMYLSMPAQLQVVGAVKLFELAGGPDAVSAMEMMTYGEVEALVRHWIEQSDFAHEDSPVGVGIDWSELLR